MVTLVSSLWQLFNGQATETNAHIIIRALFTLIGVCIYSIFNHIDISNNWIKFSIQYVTSISSIFLLIWAIGFFGELSRTAYRDAFFNWTVIFLFVITIQIIINFFINRKHC